MQAVSGKANDVHVMEDFKLNIDSLSSVWKNTKANQFLL